MIRIKNLVKKYNELEVLKGITSEIHDGEVVIVMGSSGSGKSTFLRCITRLVEPTSGEIWFDDVEITNPKTSILDIRSEIGMVFQQFNLFSNLTVLENIILAPMKVLKQTKQRAIKNAKNLLEIVKIADKINEFPKKLSGGQKQRVAIARAMAMQPKVLLFDEPTSALDPNNKEMVVETIANLAKQGMTMVIVTHEIDLALKAGTRLLFLHQGKIIADGKPKDIILKSKNKLIRDFFN